MRRLGWSLAADGGLEGGGSLEPELAVRQSTQI
jgi:hypothetical protein